MSRPRFRVEAVLGEGATGQVSRATLLEPFEDLPRGASVAVKRLRRELESDSAARTRFEAEARAGSALRHASVVRVLFAGADEDGRFLVMPFVPGESLREALAREGALPEPLVRRIGRSLAGGLAALHAAGFAHGDVKPENVRLDAEGLAVLIDLGFAHALDAPAAGGVAPRPGSLAYLAPERARGERGGAESDLFALGIVLYELATGVHPFAPAAARLEGALARSGSSGAFARTALRVPDADRLLAEIASGRHPPASRLAPRVSPFLDQVLEDLLRRDPASRPTAEELSARLEEQEAGTWWRSEVELSPAARRGGLIESDAQHLTPFVGRASERAQLFAAWEAARARPVALWLAGPPGIGKSRLLNEFAREARRSEPPPLVLYGRCRELDEDVPCQPILRMLERWLRLPSGAPPGARDRAELAALVPPGAAEALALALAGSPEAAAARSLPLSLGEWLAALATRAPLVVQLDDAPWAGEGTLEVFEHLAAELRARPTARQLLLVLAERGGARARAPQAWGALAPRLTGLGLDTQRIELAPLTREDVAELVERTFHASAPRLRLSEVLWEKSAGSPGVVAELVRGLVARGEARALDEGGLALSVEPDRLRLPTSVRQAIAAAYRALPRAERTWLRRLAVVGGRIEGAFLERVFPDARRSEIDALLARLAREGWLVPSGPRWRFARPAQREAVYRLLSRAQRRELHAAAAAVLHAAPGATAPLEDEFQRAFHLRAAGDDERLIDVVPPLLARLLASGQPQRVAPLARWGLDALERLPRTGGRARLLIELLEAAADAADRLGLRADQRAALDRLADTALESDADAHLAARAYLLHARYAISTGQYGLARGQLRNATELFADAGAEAELADARRRLALVQAHVGELAEARTLAERALRGAPNRDQEALARLALATIDVLEDKVEDALEQTEQSIDALRAGGKPARPGLLAAAHLVRARVYRSLGWHARALASAASAVRLARQAAERRLETEALVRLAQLHLDSGGLEQAESELREALRLAVEIEDRRGEALAGTFLGILLWERDAPGAAPHLERAAALAEEMGLNRITALSCAVRARIALIESRDHAAAMDWSARALALLERYGAESADRIVIQGTRALVLETVGLPDEARALERDLCDRLARENERLRSPLLRLRQSRAGQRLLEAVATVEGPLYPRAAEGPAGQPAGTR